MIEALSLSDKSEPEQEAVRKVLSDDLPTTMWNPVNKDKTFWQVYLENFGKYSKNGASLGNYMQDRHNKVALEVIGAVYNPASMTIAQAEELLARQGAASLAPGV